jgi:hypothetical protein
MPDFVQQQSDQSVANEEQRRRLPEVLRSYATTFDECFVPDSDAGNVARRAADEIAALTARLTVLSACLDRVAPEGGMFAPDNDSCVWSGSIFPGFRSADCKHAADCAWVAARAALEGQ